MSTTQQDRGPTDGLDDFPDELRAVLTSVRASQAPRSLVERVTQSALELETVSPEARLLTVQAGKARMGASRRGLIYAFTTLALTALLTIGFFAREKERDNRRTDADELPILSAIAVLPLLQWDQGQFEQDLTRMETELRHTADAVQIQAVREEIDRVLAEFKK